MLTSLKKHHHSETEVQYEFILWCGCQWKQQRWWYCLFFDRGDSVVLLGYQNPGVNYCMPMAFGLICKVGELDFLRWSLRASGSESQNCCFELFGVNHKFCPQLWVLHCEWDQLVAIRWSGSRWPGWGGPWSLGRGNWGVALEEGWGWGYKSPCLERSILGRGSTQILRGSRGRWMTNGKSCRSTLKETTVVRDIKCGMDYFDR